MNIVTYRVDVLGPGAPVKSSATIVGTLRDRINGNVSCSLEIAVTSATGEGLYTKNHFSKLLRAIADELAR